MTRDPSPDAPTVLRRHGRIVLGAAVLLTAFAASAGAQAPRVETRRLTPDAMAAPETYFGTVRARDIAGLSYGARGCIVEVAEDARRERVAAAGQVLVRLDDRRSLLALRTAEARVLELAAAVEERQLAIEAARADDLRRQQDLAFVSDEFQRNSTMLGRGLINESAMDAVERRFMDATFAAERAKEAIANALAAKKRAEIALEIGRLEQQSAEIGHDMLYLRAPFDGALVGFDANIGDCVQEGALAGRIYEPARKSVDVYFRISRLTGTRATGLAVGAPVRVRRVNGQDCGGAITRIDTEADAESQYVEATVDVEEVCAPSLFLNESVRVEAAADAGGDAYSVPNSAISGENTVYLVDETTQRLVAVAAEVVRRGDETSIVRIPGAAGRLLVTESAPALADGMAVDAL